MQQPTVGALKTLLSKNLRASSTSRDSKSYVLCKANLTAIYSTPTFFKVDLNHRCHHLAFRSKAKTSPGVTYVL